MRGIITGMAGAFVAIAREISALPPLLFVAGMLLGFAAVGVVAVFLS